MATQGSQYADSSTWSPIVRAVYPDILSSTHSVPPMIFNHVPYARAIVPGTEHVPGSGSGPGAGLPALVLQRPLAAGDPLPIHDLTPDWLSPMPSAPSQQPVPSSASQQPVPSSASQQPVPSTSRGFLNMKPLLDLLSRFVQRKSEQKKQPGRTQQKSKPILPPVLQTDVNDDEAQTQVLRNLEELGKHRKEVMFIISQLNFTDYLNKPEYAVAAAQLPAVPVNPCTGQQTDGEIDVLIINRRHGILIGEIKVVGRDSHSRSDAIINKTITKALKQLDNSKALMSHLVSDVPSPGLSVQTTLVLPFVSRTQLQRVFTADPNLAQAACNTLGAADAVEAAKLCLCSDQLSKPSTWWDVTPNVTQELDTWWRGRMNHTDPGMSDDIYVDLIARFVGPATSVTVNCTTRPRLEVKTVDQAVDELGNQLSMLVLTPEQIDIMRHRDEEKYKLVYLTGPPGTGKTVLLTLVGLCRLHQGKDVHVVSGYNGSRAASSLIEHQLETTLTSYSTSTSGCGNVFLHHYELWKRAEKDRAVNELTDLTALGPDIFLIFDELARPRSSRFSGRTLSVDYGLGQPPRYFPDLLSELRARVSTLRIWAAGILHGIAPPGLLQIPLTTPLRSAPSILREMQKQITGRAWSQRVHPYNNTMFPAAGDGMRVERLVHERGDINGHTGYLAQQCFLCGQNLAALLRSRGVGSELHCRDVLVLSDDMDHFRKKGTTNLCRLAQGIQHSGLAVQVMADPDLDRANWEREVDQVAKATGNSILMTDYEYVLGMERKVVVLLQGYPDFMVFAASRATTQLVVVENK